MNTLTLKKKMNRRVSGDSARKLQGADGELSGVVVYHTNE